MGEKTEELLQRIADSNQEIVDLLRQRPRRSKSDDDQAGPEQQPAKGTEVRGD